MGHNVDFNSDSYFELWKLGNFINYDLHFLHKTNKHSENMWILQLISNINFQYI